MKKCVKYSVEGAGPGGGSGRVAEKLWKNTVRHVNRMGRMPWIVIDGGNI